jgi:hypothetical protein
MESLHCRHKYQPCSEAVLGGGGEGGSGCSGGWAEGAGSCRGPLIGCGGIGGCSGDANSGGIAGWSSQKLWWWCSST